MPQSVRSAMQRPRIPALAAWQFLPGILFNEIEHPEPEQWATDQESVVVDVVRGISSALAWICTKLNPPTDEEADKLKRHALRIYTETLNREGSDSDESGSVQQAAIAASKAVGLLQRSQLFASRERTAQCARMVSRWVHSGVKEFLYPTRLGMRLADDQLNTRFFFLFVPVEVVIQVHDGMLSHWLWSELRLDDAIAPLHFFDLGYPAVQLRKAVDFLFEHDPATIEPDFALVTGDIVHDAKVESWRADSIENLCLASFALRLFDIPAVAERAIGRPADAVADRMRQNQFFSANVLDLFPTRRQKHA